MEISSVPGHGSTFTCHFAPAQVAQAWVISAAE